MSPNKPRHTRLIQISYGKCIVHLILFSNGSCLLEFKSNVLCKTITSKTIHSDTNYIFKNTSLQRAAQAPMGSFERTKSREHPLRTIIFYESHLQHECCGDVIAPHITLNS